MTSLRMRVIRDCNPLPECVKAFKRACDWEEISQQARHVLHRIPPKLNASTRELQDYVSTFLGQEAYSLSRRRLISEIKGYHPNLGNI